MINGYTQFRIELFRTMLDCNLAYVFAYQMLLKPTKHHTQQKKKRKKHL
jgi:hypothetical protein